MPFERGTFPLTILKLAGDLPDNTIELFSKYKAGRIEDVKDEVQIGWTGFNHLLETKLDEENMLLGGFVFSNLRTAKKKISPAQLKADIRIEELVHIRASGNADISRKKKKEIREDVTERLMKDATPQFSGIQVVIDQTDNTIYLGASSIAAVDTFTALFNDTFSVAPIQMLPEELMAEEKILSSSYSGLKLLKDEDAEFTPGRDFLTWLWYYSENEGGEIDVKNYGRFAVMADGPLTFASEGQGAFESVVRKGNPLKSAEAKTALQTGKKLKKANLTFARADELWSCSFDADIFSFSGMKLPEGEEMDYTGRFNERINNLHIFKEVFKTYFEKFLTEINTNNQPVNESIAKWIETRISF